MSEGATSERTSEWTPEFEGQREPFQPGNAAAVKHGAHSPREIEKEVARQGDDLAERYPALAEHPETYNAIRRVRAVTNLLFSSIVKQPLDKKGEVRVSTVARYISAENAYAKLRESAGMTPASEIAIARERAEAMRSVVDLHALAARGRAALESRNGAQAPHDLTTLEPDAGNKRTREDPTHD